MGDAAHQLADRSLLPADHATCGFDGSEPPTSRLLTTGDALDEAGAGPDWLIRPGPDPLRQSEAVERPPRRRP